MTRSRSEAGLGDSIRISAQPAARELSKLHFAFCELIAEQLPHILVEPEVLNLELDALVWAVKL